MSINNTIKSLGVSLLLMTFFSCKTVVKFTKTSPCANLEASVQHWIGGAYGSGKGVIITISAEKTCDFQADTVYYNGQKGKLILKSASPQLIYEANLSQVTAKEAEISGAKSSDYDTENIAKKGELVVRFSKANKAVYYKFLSFKKKPILMYAVAKPRE